VGRDLQPHCVFDWSRAFELVRCIDLFVSGRRGRTAFKLVDLMITWFEDDGQTDVRPPEKEERSIVIVLQDTYATLSSSGPLQLQLGWHGWLSSQQQCWSCGIEGEGEEMFGGDSPISPSLSAAETEKEKMHG